MKRGGRAISGVRPWFILAAVVVFAVGLIVVRKAAHSLEDRLMADLPTEQTIAVLLAARVENETDPNKLLDLGASLASKGDASLALIALRKAATIAPASRDIQYALAWAQLADYQKRAAQVTRAELQDIERALRAARSTDPLDGRVRELETTLAELMANGGDR